MTRRAALIVAGGKARRFQSKQGEWRDKALAELSGKPLLVHVVEAAVKVVDEVVVCVNDEQREQTYLNVLEKRNLSNFRFAVDEKISHVSGPNVAIMSGLKASQAEFCLTLPCDVPLITPNVIEYLFDAASDMDIAVLIWPNGRLETLIMVLRRNRAVEVAETLCSLRRPRSDDIPRGLTNIRFVSPVGEMKRLDPELRSFVNINHPEDLAKPQARPVQGNITANFNAKLGELLIPEIRRLRETNSGLHEHEFADAVSLFSSCAATLEKCKSPFWAGISREKEGEALLTWSQHLKEPKASAELDFKGKDAFLAAAVNYETEALMHLQSHCRFLAERARADKAWCESKAMGKIEQLDRYLSSHK